MYGAGVALRNRLFDVGILPSERIEAPVISVGNILVGGVGKTPVVEMLARKLTAKGRKVAIVSRGYKRTSSGYLVVSNGNQRCANAPEAGDEPAQLADKLTGVVVIVDEKKVRGAAHAVKDFKSEVVILDDGFQHRYLKRDLDIVVLSADELIAGSWLLPVGRRREPLNSLRRAHLLVVSRCRDRAHFESATHALRRWADKPAIGIQMQATSLREAATKVEKELSKLKHATAVAFSGIGLPDSFEETLRSLQIKIQTHVAFQDHHRYELSDLHRVGQKFENEHADFLLTTEKDVLRLQGERELADWFFRRYPVHYVEIQPRVFAGEEELDSFLAKF